MTDDGQLMEIREPNVEPKPNRAESEFGEAKSRKRSASEPYAAFKDHIKCFLFVMAGPFFQSLMLILSG